MPPGPKRIAGLLKLPREAPRIYVRERSIERPDFNQMPPEGLLGASPAGPGAPVPADPPLFPSEEEVAGLGLRQRPSHNITLYRDDLIGHVERDPPYWSAIGPVSGAALAGGAAALAPAGQAEAAQPPPDLNVESGGRPPQRGPMGYTWQGLKDAAAQLSSELLADSFGQTAEDFARWYNYLPWRVRSGLSAALGLPAPQEAQ